jgi:flagellar biosynthesis/type III secretory pathway M-ring protein FliF/YscJ
METLWLFAVVIGPLLLIGFIIYAVRRNRSDSPENVARAERGAREVREEIAHDEEEEGTR